MMVGHSFLFYTGIALILQGGIIIIIIILYHIYYYDGMRVSLTNKQTKFEVRFRQETKKRYRCYVAMLLCCYHSRAWFTIINSTGMGSSVQATQ